jgi:hypothetical protein
MSSERCPQVSMCNVETRQSATLMSGQRGSQQRGQTSHPHPHMATLKTAALSVSNGCRCGLPSKVNALDKRADCTTTLVLDVDAAAHDRATASCGVRDVLAELGLMRPGVSSVTLSCLVLNSHPHSHPTAASASIHCRVSPSEFNDSSTSDWCCANTHTHTRPVQRSQLKHVPHTSAICAAAVVAAIRSTEHRAQSRLLSENGADHGIRSAQPGFIHPTPCVLHANGDSLKS